MKKFFYVFVVAGMAFLPQVLLSSCRGKSAAKAVELIEKATSKSGKAIKNAGKYADDAYRVYDELNSSSASTMKAVTYPCATCAGNGQVNFFDEYGNYTYTGTCPSCNGDGSIIQYEYE